MPVTMVHTGHVPKHLCSNLHVDFTRKYVLPDEDGPLAMVCSVPEEAWLPAFTGLQSLSQFGCTNLLFQVYDSGLGVQGRV